MTDGWRKIERGLFESADGQWRIANPWKLTTELRHRWLVAERRASGSGWCMHDGDHATLQDARAYIRARELAREALYDPRQRGRSTDGERPRRSP